MATATPVEEKQKIVEAYIADAVYKRDKEGLLIIIDQRTTKKGEMVNSNERDIQKIRDTFGSLGFHIHDIEDLKNLNANRLTSRFKSAVAKYNQERDENGERKYDCLVVFLLSYSSEKNHVAASDGDYVIETLFESIQEYFVGKPKVFFFRTPNSKEETHKVEFEVVDDEDDDHEEVQRGKGTSVVIPQRADYLVVINSHSFKEEPQSESGWRSDFIDNLTDYITENSTKDENSIKDLMYILTRLQARLAQLEPWNQQEGMMPLRLTDSTLTKKLYLKRK
ncbi:caspase-3-like protein [Leptotrombidium deliense]|uniref:Caspase-3-like protein n=1 Tax=Leptotrombidium deliense TaxID=299467 RepID=A0A443RX17_9ACAR|nr:caspase-3-like protein [Leptotrombidium deliense]